MAGNAVAFPLSGNEKVIFELSCLILLLFCQQGSPSPLGEGGSDDDGELMLCHFRLHTKNCHIRNGNRFLKKESLLGETRGLLSTEHFPVSTCRNYKGLLVPHPPSLVSCT